WARTSCSSARKLRTRSNATTAASSQTSWRRRERIGRALPPCERSGRSFSGSRCPHYYSNARLGRLDRQRLQDVVVLVARREAFHDVLPRRFDSEVERDRF